VDPVLVRVKLENQPMTEVGLDVRVLVPHPRLLHQQTVVQFPVAFRVLDGDGLVRLLGDRHLVLLAAVRVLG
jgi:hypothetical protein